MTKDSSKDSDSGKILNKIIMITFQKLDFNFQEF